MLGVEKHSQSFSNLGNDALVNLKISREVQLFKSTVKIILSVTLKNNGRNQIDSFYILMEQRLAVNLASLVVKESNNIVSVERVHAFETHASVFKVTPASPIPSNGSLSYTSVILAGHLLSPLPKSVGLTEDQYVVYNDFQYYYSPYRTAEQTATFRLSPGESFRNVQPKEILGQESDSKARCGSFVDIAPFQSGSVVTLHFRHRSHLGYFSSVHREIDVSHWGSVVFHELYKFKNEAATLKGEYDRVSVSRISNRIPGRQPEPSPTHIVFQMNAVLPHSSFGISYYDEIGNISGSHARRETTYLHMDVQPRFPIFGGWHSNWQLDYSIPVQAALLVSTNSNTHSLAVPFAPPFSRYFADELTTTIALPQGAYDINLVTPQPTVSVERGSTYGWFDIAKPRPTITWKAKNVYIDDRDVNKYKFQVKYAYNHSVSDARQPLTICFIILVPFLLFILSQRWSLRIARKAEAEEQDADLYESSMAEHLTETIEDFFSAQDDFLSKVAEFESRPIKRNLKAAQTTWENRTTVILTDVETKVSKLPATLRSVPNLMRSLQQAVATLSATKTRRDESGKAKVKDKALQQAETAVCSAESELLNYVKRRKPKLKSS